MHMDLLASAGDPVIDPPPPVDTEAAPLVINIDKLSTTVRAIVSEALAHYHASNPSTLFIATLATTFVPGPTASITSESSLMMAQTIPRYIGSCPSVLR